MFDRSRPPPPHTHECCFLLELGQAPCLTGTAPTCLVAVGVEVVWVRKEDLGLVWQGARRRAEAAQEEVLEATSLALGAWGEEGHSEMATVAGTVEVGGKVQDWH